MDIQIKNLTKTYNNRKILAIDGFHIPSKSFLGIIGPNGAGKSTLVKIIAGLDTPSTGCILYNHEGLNQRINRNMTMVFQKPYLLRTTVYNNIAYPLKLRNINKEEIHTRVQKIIGEMGIAGLQHQKAWTLSGGEGQKVALARALIFNPSLLILDEATANIDPSSIYAMEDAIKCYYENNHATIIMVTHNIKQAKRLCNTVAFMNGGVIEESGTSDEVIYNPTKEATKTFIKEAFL
ncbi:ATP-binding cassette domain-containing protein [Alkaliphilus serpentinus]|uniref:ATP-binding cassette domain-containing protein n=1 Tax=Alkaliphilus serpentinus TaxID=1482731 RepID=A0A833HLI5_9FIRM|nr:ATP-binding cassette domain-containing protein [Alkaliphilus serpentinus]KAB3525737.1 ATP-binding cassette domain-containing protein [Alkaliphilus serpentinus]